MASLIVVVVFIDVLVGLFRAVVVVDVVVGVCVGGVTVFDAIVGLKRSQFGETPVCTVFSFVA